jgi:putative effector of murein hydrolase
MVGRSLGKLHWLALISGIAFLFSSAFYERVTQGTAHPFALRHVLIVLMLALTSFSQYWIIPRMDALRATVADFATVPLNDPARLQFDALHVWSTRVEGAVLVLGLVAVYLTAGVLAKR